MSIVNFANNFRLFQNDQLGSIRAFYRDGNIWFSASDACTILGLDNPTAALRRLDDDEQDKIYSKELTLISNKGNQRLGTEINIVNESGLYTLVLGSRKPQAKEFKRWLAHDVIPSIRQHGGYVYGQEKLPEKERTVIVEELADMASMIKKLRARRHELIGENRQLKDDKRQLKREQKALNEYADLFEDMFEKAQSEYAKAAEEVEVLKNRIERMKHPEAFVEPDRGSEMFITNDGVVMSREVWDALQEVEDEREI